MEPEVSDSDSSSESRLSGRGDLRASASARRATAHRDPSREGERQNGAAAATAAAAKRKRDRAAEQPVEGESSQAEEPDWYTEEKLHRPPTDLERLQTTQQALRLGLHPQG